MTAEENRRSVSAIVVAYGHTPLLQQVVDAILASTGLDDVEVVVVDNGSADGTVTALRPDPRLVVAGDGANLGFGGGCNLGATLARHPVLAFVNPDAVVDPPALARLAAPLSDPAVGITTARVRLLREPELLNSSGGAIHFLGLGWASGYRQPIEQAETPAAVAAASGAGMAITASLFAALGGFTEELFLYHEDAELSLRCWMAGREVRYVPDADVFHDYEFGRNPTKMYHLERNRLLLVGTCFEARTLLLLAPPLLVLEVAMTAMALAQGWFGAKVSGWVWIVRHRRWVRDDRRKIQRARVRSDRELAHLLSDRFEGGQVAMPAAARPADAALGAYWRLVRRWL